jgi:hypothetical protein
MHHNGQPIKGGCVTRSCPDRSVGGRHRVEYQYFSREAVTSLTLTDRRERHGVQGGYGVLFAIMVQILLNITRFKPWPNEVSVRVSRWKSWHAKHRQGYKFDRSCEFIPGYKVSGGHWRSVAVQTISKPEIYHSAGFYLHADARVRVHEPLQSCLRYRIKSKKHDKQLTHIVRVSLSDFS